MLANSSPMAVGDYCNALNSGKIIVNQDYQRQEGLWRAFARSYFIESVLLGFPIPKLFLYSRLDLKSRETIKEIVDGQQRSHALRMFFNNRLKLSGKLDTEEFRGKKYNDLSEELQTKFLSYNLPIDQFSGVPEEDVREAFRRMNASTIPLNDDEQRNAEFQGPFKWFINSICREYKEALFNIGLFSKRDLIRMADYRLFGEVVLILDDGFVTTKKKQLDDLYKKYNVEFPQEDEVRTKIEFAVKRVFEDEGLRDPALMRAHMFQTLLTAIIGQQFGGDFVQQARDAEPELAQKLENAPVALDVLCSALRDPEEENPDLERFILASSQKTNVDSQRIIRFLYLFAALTV
jgi:hypothetical protein